MLLYALFFLSYLFDFIVKHFGHLWVVVKGYIFFLKKTALGTRESDVYYFVVDLSKGFDKQLENPRKKA